MTHAAPMPYQAKVWIAVMAALICMSLLIGFRFYDQHGTLALIVFGGLACVPLMFVARALGGQRVEAANAPLSAPNSLVQVFEANPNPAIITRNGTVIEANKAYKDLVTRMGVITLDGVAPTVDRLFSHKLRIQSTEIFRLHHLPDGQTQGEEIVQMQDASGEFLQFKITVMYCGDEKFWQITDVTQDVGLMDAHLSMAPIGLLMIKANGEIIACNQGLRDWIGADASYTPRHLNDILSDADAILKAPHLPGRTARSETRLKTLKGIATPAVVVASWREIPGGAYVANVALHGHTAPARHRFLQRPGDASSQGSGDPLASEASHRSSGEEAGQAQAGHDGEALPHLIAAPRNQNGDLEQDVSDFSYAPIAIVELDGTDLRAAKVQRVNSAFTVMTGVSDWQNRTLEELLAKQDTGLEFLDMDATLCAPDTPYDAVLAGADKIAVSVYIVADTMAGKCRIYLVDISMRKSLEDQLVQSQKMQAIGRLVAEIAHDFNNILAAMRLYTDTLLERHPIGDPSYPDLQQINSNGNRAKALVSKLLGYSRKQTVRAVKLQVSEAMSDIAITLKQVMGERVNVKMVHGRDLPPVKVDRNQLDQVLMNLAVNARDAMKEQGGGTIIIKSEVLNRSDIESAALKGALSPIQGPRFVVISVKDTGTGMTEETKSKIFEPFFTTKGQGEGTGLGLATVYGIINQAGGHLAVDSEVGVGTTFTIYLPAYEGEMAKNEPVPDAPQPIKIKAPADLAGQGQILFVEDEDAVRGIAARTLRKRGYNVVEACNGEEAYDILETQDTAFDLMISDVVMPGMDGPTLLRKARSKLEDTRIVFISGYAEEEFSDLLSEEPDVTFLPKPFSLVQLAEKVKSEIGEV